jgi:hypothetical protein
MAQARSILEPVQAISARRTPQKWREFKRHHGFLRGKSALLARQRRSFWGRLK